MYNDDAVKLLNDLIQTSEDEQNGFADAMAEATKPDLKILFFVRSIDCGTAVIELQRLVKSLGGKPKDSGRLADTVCPSWVRHKPSTGNANIATLEDVDRAESMANAAYAKALSAELPQQIRLVVQRQYEYGVRNHDLIRGLRSDYEVTTTSVQIQAEAGWLAIFRERPPRLKESR